jgi:hypothetical protein
MLFEDEEPGEREEPEDSGEPAEFAGEGLAEDEDE